MLAFSAVAVTSAFAEESKLLAGGVAITALLPLLVEGELLLQDLGATPSLNIDCSGKFDGWVEPGGTLGYITDLLMLGGELLNELGELNGAGNDMIDCEVLNSSVCSKNEVLLTVNLNGTTRWHWELILDVGGQYLIDFLNTHDIEELLENTSEVLQPSYTADCETLLGLAEDTCEGLSSARLYMQGTNLRGSFNSLAIGTDGWSAESEGTACSLGGAGQGMLESISGAAEDTELSGGLITDSADGSALSLSP